MTTISPRTGAVDVEDDIRDRRAGWPVALLLLALALGALALGALSGDDPVAAGQPDTTTTTAPTTSSSLAGTTTTSAIEQADPVAIARDQLVAVIESVHPSELKPKDRKAMVKKVEDAIAGADDGDIEEASKKLNDLAKDLDNHLDQEVQLQALSALESLADALGIELGETDHQEEEEEEEDD